MRCPLFHRLSTCCRLVPALACILLVLVAVPGQAAQESQAPSPSLEDRLKQLEAANRVVLEQNRLMLERETRLREESEARYQSLERRYEELRNRLEVRPVGEPGAEEAEAADGPLENLRPENVEGSLWHLTPETPHVRPEGWHKPLKAQLGEGFEFHTEDEEYSLRLHILNQVDFKNFVPGNQVPAKSGIYIPRVRLYFEGQLTRLFDYEVSLQRSVDGVWDLLDANLRLNYSRKFQLLFGRQLVPYSYDWYDHLEQYFITPERALFPLNFGLSREAGLLARGFLHAGRAEEAADAAAESIGLQFGNPQGHFLLGAALASQEQFEAAVRPLENCLHLAPRFLRAQRLLARVYRRLGQPQRAALCESQAFVGLHDLRQKQAAAEAAVREQAGARAAVRAEADRIRQVEIDRRKAEYDAIEPKDFLIVSGLPRSGTSLMMQVLRAGGIEPLTDAKRAADEDNPEGYWEWDDIKKLPKNPRLIEAAEGKVVKVISALLPNLPGKHRYTIIYMVRPTEQVVNSQWAMLARKGSQPKSEKKHLIEVQEHHSRQIREVLKKSERVTLLEVSFPDLVADPEPVIAKLAELLPRRFTPGPAVAACVKPQLFRNRG